jgi:hypothetical protein
MTDAAAVSDRSHTFDIDMSTRGPWSWLATGRYGVRPAPNGLALVQDFLNTRASTLTGPDMLCDNVNATPGPRTLCAHGRLSAVRYANRRR